MVTQERDLRPPKLSPQSRARWDLLHATYIHTVAEVITLTECLKAHDRALAADARGDKDLAVKERQAEMRLWRLLRYDQGERRRPGRPADTNWSPQRKHA